MMLFTFCWSLMESPHWRQLLTTKRFLIWDFFHHLCKYGFLFSNFVNMVLFCYDHVLKLLYVKNSLVVLVSCCLSSLFKTGYILRQFKIENNCSLVKTYLLQYNTILTIWLKHPLGSKGHGQHKNTSQSQSCHSQPYLSPNWNTRRTICYIENFDYTNVQHRFQICFSLRMFSRLRSWSAKTQIIILTQRQQFISKSIYYYMFRFSFCDNTNDWFIVRYVYISIYIKEI